MVDEQLMGFHYARDHDLAGFWGEVCELAHRVHRKAALLSPTPVTDLEKTLNIGPTQRLFCQVSARRQDFEIPAQALHEQVFFVIEFRIQARFAHTCGLFKVLNTRLSEAMLPEDWDCFIEDILSGEQFSSSHCNIICQFELRGLHIKDQMVHYCREGACPRRTPCPLAVNSRSSIS